MKVKFLKLVDTAVTPSYAKPGDAGMDITAIAHKINTEHNFIEYHTGLAFEVPEGHVGLLFPRSSVSKKDLSLANCVGVVDSGYRGPIKLRFKATNGNSKLAEIYDVGERVGQIIIMPVPFFHFEEVDELSDTNRGEGGFGSTGN